jgi:1-deoxy-D-xylulose-5-phosphate synthase
VGSGLRGRKVRTGRDLCILAVGKMLAAATQAADELAAEGIEASVWDVRVVPLDPAMLADAAEHPVVLTAEDGIRDGGVGALIADRISQIDGIGPAPRVRVLGTPIAYIPQAKPDAILSELGLDAAGLAREGRALVSALRA